MNGINKRFEENSKIANKRNMRNVQIRQEKQSEAGWEFWVEVEEDGSKTSHLVKVTKDYFANFSNGFSSVEDLVRKSFDFLLAREPKESILREFDISVIKDYFPEYEERIKNG